MLLVRARPSSSLVRESVAAAPWATFRGLARDSLEGAHAPSRRALENRVAQRAGVAKTLKGDAFKSPGGFEAACVRAKEAPSAGGAGQIGTGFRREAGCDEPAPPGGPGEAGQVHPLIADIPAGARAVSGPGVVSGKERSRPKTAPVSILAVASYSRTDVGVHSIEPTAG